MGEFDDLISEFVTESREHIADIEDDLIKIESEMENVDPEVINRVFRAAHSIKGSAKFLDLSNIGDRLAGGPDLRPAGGVVLVGGRVLAVEGGRGDRGDPWRELLLARLADAVGGRVLDGRAGALRPVVLVRALERVRHLTPRG